MVILFAVATLWAQNDQAKTVRSTDPAIAPILESLMTHPKSAKVQAQSINVGFGEYAHCEIHGSDMDCDPRTKIHRINRLVLMFDFGGRSVEVIGGCSPSDNRHCGELTHLGEAASLSCSEPSKDVYVCMTTGWNNFLIERKKGAYFIFPVEVGNKPNRRYYIPLASIDGLVVSD